MVKMTTNIPNIRAFKCSAHTLQLSVKLILDSAKELIDKVREVVKFFRKSPKQSQRLIEHQISFPISSTPLHLLDDCITR